MNNKAEKHGCMYAGFCRFYQSLAMSAMMKGKQSPFAELTSYLRILKLARLVSPRSYSSSDGFPEHRIVQ
jgi:hypothetical protein